MRPAASRRRRRPKPRAAYDARWQRIMDCVALKQPDRMPAAMFCTFWLAKYGGISHRQLMYDYEKTKEIGERAVLEFEPGRVIIRWCSTTAAGPVLDAVDFKQLHWPGHGVGDNQPYQYLDREYMKADEYDEFIVRPDRLLSAANTCRASAARSRASRNCPIFPGLHYFRLVGGIRGFGRPQRARGVRAHAQGRRGSGPLRRAPRRVHPAHDRARLSATYASSARRSRPTTSSPTISAAPRA